MLKRKGSWILLLPILSIFVSAFIVTHQYMRRDRLKAEIKTSRAELHRLAELLPAKYRPKTVLAEPHEHTPGDGHKH